MKFVFVHILCLFICFGAWAQDMEKTASYKFKDSPMAISLEQKIAQTGGSMKTSQDMTEARNLLILKAIIDFKMNDQKLQPYFDELKNNREFYQKLKKIMIVLDNGKYRNTKNKDILAILNDAGGKIYNNFSN